MSATGDRIVEAALTLIAERGLSRVTMSAIAAEAGVARQTLYNHYADVDSIVADALTKHHEVALANLTAVMATMDDPRARLEQLVRHQAAVATHDHHSSSARHGLGAPVQEMVGAYERSVRSFIEDALREGLDRGAFRADLHPPRDAVFIHNLLVASSELIAAGDDPAVVAAAAIRNVQAVAGMAPVT